ncbi:MAG: PEP/pyruvate-binding domain-containing protein [Gemmataceae bacterium]
MTILFFRDIWEADAPRVGGKGFSLGRMAAAGLPVPDGFVLTTDAYRSCSLDGLGDAYRNSAADLRSQSAPSATAEDSADTSFADSRKRYWCRRRGRTASAVERCWKSLHTERAVAYRAKQGIDESQVAMAVVQKLVPADVRRRVVHPATRDPTAGLLAEASWGLVAAVPGRVSPDRFQPIARPARCRTTTRPKPIRIDAAGESPVPAEQQQRTFCLSDTALLANWRNWAARWKPSTATPATWNGPGRRAFHLLQRARSPALNAAEREADSPRGDRRIEGEGRSGGTVGDAPDPERCCRSPRR